MKRQKRFRKLKSFRKTIPSQFFLKVPKYQVPKYFFRLIIPLKSVAICSIAFNVCRLSSRGTVFFFIFYMGPRWSFFKQNKKDRKNYLDLNSLVQRDQAERYPGHRQVKGAALCHKGLIMICFLRMIMSKKKRLAIAWIDSNKF